MICYVTPIHYPSLTYSYLFIFIHDHLHYLGVNFGMGIVLFTSDLLFKYITIRCGYRCCVCVFISFDLTAADYKWCFNKIQQPQFIMINGELLKHFQWSRICSQLCICRRLKILLKTLSLSLPFSIELSIILLTILLFNAIATQSISARFYPRPASHQYKYYPHSHHLVGQQQQQQQKQLQQQ